MNAPAIPAEIDVSRRAVIVRGVAWNALFQVFLVLANFASMLLLVRVISPVEFGRATAVTGLLAFINCFNCSTCIAQAIQVPPGKDPDWPAHWHAGLYIQFVLGIICNVVAGIAWFVPPYRSIAPLLHIASIGLFIDCPNQLALAALRRDMNFKALRMVQAICVLLSISVSITLGLLGAGAFALIIASNVVHGIPQGLYLFCVRRWRPPPRWWSPPDWTRYRDALKFGGSLSTSAVLVAARGMFESIFLPGALGYEAIGLLSRAQVLFSTTVGRVTSLLIETIYPLLPRSAGDPPQFARHATVFMQILLLLSIPGAVFVATDGPLLSRVLYGSKWVAADPLILPATLFAWGLSTALTGMIVLQAQNRLKHTLLGNLSAAALCIPAVLVAIGGGGPQAYAWSLASGQSAAATIGLLMAGRYLEVGWVSKVLVAPVVCSCIAATARLITPFDLLPPSFALFLRAMLFGTAFVVTFRILFSVQMRLICSRIPGGAIIGKLAWL